MTEAIVHGFADASLAKNIAIAASACRMTTSVSCVAMRALYFVSVLSGCAPSPSPPPPAPPVLSVPPPTAPSPSFVSPPAAKALPDRLTVPPDAETPNTPIGFSEDKGSIFILCSNPDGVTQPISTAKELATSCKAKPGGRLVVRLGKGRGITLREAMDEASAQCVAKALALAGDWDCYVAFR
jgi:hypothetical protein